MRAAVRWFSLVGAAAAVAVAVLVGTPASAAETPLVVDRTSIDFGTVTVGTTTGSVPVTLTNTGSTPFGPMNMFGGAPPSTSFSASQNCQGITLAAGGSCQVSFTFQPDGAGVLTDTSSFTISATASQSDGENFAISLVGCGAGAGCAPSATTTPTTTPATTTPTTGATPAPLPGDPQSPQPLPGGTETPSGSGPTFPADAPLDMRAVVASVEVEAGAEQAATARGFQPAEVVRSMQQPEGTDLGEQIADANGLVSFTWTIAESDADGEKEFVATGEVSGSASAPFTVVAAASDDDDTDFLPIAIIVVVVLLAIGGIGYWIYRRRHRGAPANDEPPPGGEPTAPTPTTPGPPER